jgi:hypothetical protein
MLNTNYNRVMDLMDRVTTIDRAHWSGQEISNLLSGVHEDLEHYIKIKAPKEVVLYYRDLLAYLIKTYGH